MSKESKVFIEITNRDIYDTLQEMKRTQKVFRSVQSEILTQAKLTNGRINTLEKHSIGFWAKENTGKAILTAIIALVVIGVVSISTSKLDLL